MGSILNWMMCVIAILQEPIIQNVSYVSLCKFVLFDDQDNQT